MAGTHRDSKTTVVITITVEDSAPIEVTDSYPMDEVEEVITFEDSYPSSMPPLGENTQPAEEDPPDIKATQSALDEARSKLDAADARLNELRIKRKQKSEGVIDLTETD